MHHLSIDLETYSSVPIAKAGAQKYISSPDFEILLFAYSLDGAPVEIIDLARGEQLPPWLVQAITSPDYIKHAYNAPFEWGCLSKFLGTLPPDQWRCTMFHGLYCGYTAGLDATGKALGLAEDKRKLNTGKALIRYFCVPCAPTKANGGRTRNLPQHDTDKWELFKEYCRQDVVTEMEIERRLSAFPVPDFVQKQWETDLIINARGVAVDMDLVSGALYLGNVTRQNLTQEAMKISKLDNPNSVAQLTQWLQEAMGEELADLRKDTVARLLGKEDNSPQVQRMLEIRQELGKTSTKKYDAIEAAVCPDGRVRGLLQFYGANRTGRWAGRLVQVQNLPRTYTEPLPLARELVEQRKEEARAKANAPVTKVSLEDLFSQIQAGEMKNLNIIVKADVQGSVEAVKASLEKLSNDEVRVRVIHGGVGAINESDVMLASTSQAIIVGFNVRPDNAARDSAARAHVDMRMYRVIYDAINEIESAMKGMLAPKFREALLGHAEVRQTYKVSGVGTVAGCYVQDGKIVRACSVRVVRDGIVIHEGSLASLKRFKDDVKEVAENYECGMTVEKFNDIKEGDIVEAFTMEEIPQ